MDEILKKIVEFEISLLEYPLVLRFILNKVVWSFAAKVALNGILRGEFTKVIVKFGINTLEYAFVSFISNKAPWSFGTKYIQKKVFYGQNF